MHDIGPGGVNAGEGFETARALLVCGRVTGVRGGKKKQSLSTAVGAMEGSGNSDKYKERKKTGQGANLSGRWASRATRRRDSG
jgi:hypothetical protein